METLFIIILSLIFLSFLLRKLSPFILAYFINRLQKKMKNNLESSFKNNFKQSRNQKQTNKNQNKDKVGEYIDFEEID